MGDLTPNTREEYFLARMAGEDVVMPEPITREEEYMKGIAAQIEAGSAELPAVTDMDEGKILAVNASGKWDKADAPTELPEVTAADNGKVLAVDEVSGDVIWQTPSGASFTPLTVNIRRTTMVWNNSYTFNGYAFLDFCFTKSSNTNANSVIGDWDDLPKIANAAGGNYVGLTAYEVSGTTTHDIRGVAAYNGASAASLIAGNTDLPAGTWHVSGSYKLATN